MGTSVDVLFPITSEMGDTECADISILDDDALECEQDFNVAISSATLGTEFAGPLSQAVVTIEDNDSKSVHSVRQSSWLHVYTVEPLSSGNAELRACQTFACLPK